MRWIFFFFCSNAPLLCYGMLIETLDLLFLHRNYLAVALRAENPLAHQYSGSVLAAYRCATRLCSALRDFYRLHPNAVGRMWNFWSGVFSACVSRR